jgi:hypothetical protein
MGLRLYYFFDGEEEIKLSISENLFFIAIKEFNDFDNYY